MKRRRRIQANLERRRAVRKARGNHHRPSRNEKGRRFRQREEPLPDIRRFLRIPGLDAAIAALFGARRRAKDKPVKAAGSEG